MIPTDLLYTDQHEWVKLEDGIATVGITDHAQNALGDITFVELPDEGANLAKGDEACAIESAKAAASIYAPGAGTIAAANAALADDPSAINSAPYGAGWVYKIALDDAAELDGLMNAEQYEAYLAQE